MKKIFLILVAMANVTTCFAADSNDERLSKWLHSQVELLDPEYNVRLSATAEFNSKEDLTKLEQPELERLLAEERAFQLLAEKHPRLQDAIDENRISSLTEELERRAFTGQEAEVIDVSLLTSAELEKQAANPLLSYTQVSTE